MSKPILYDLPAKYQAQVAAQLYATPRPVTVARAATAAEPQKKRIRQNSAGLNKTEQAYLDKLKNDGWTYIYREPSLPIANGVKYNVDFLVTRGDGIIEGHEVKGRAFSTGIVKLKVAASLFPWITFRMASASKGGGWSIETILP